MKIFRRRVTFNQTNTVNIIIRTINIDNDDVRRWLVVRSLSFKRLIFLYTLRMQGITEDQLYYIVQTFESRPGILKLLRLMAPFYTIVVGVSLKYTANFVRLNFFCRYYFVKFLRIFGSDKLFNITYI